MKVRVKVENSREEQPFEYSKRLKFRVRYSIYPCQLFALNQHIEFHGAARAIVPSRNVMIKSFVASKKKYLLFKRFFDIIFSALVILAIMSWLLPLLALLIKAGSPGPVFFKQKRVGLHGNSFYCLKFRTMIPNEEADEMQAGKDDLRITRFGGFLRRTNLDDLPQFFNVLAGQMSVVGPRPHMVADCIRFSFVISSYAFRGLVRPGVTGWAQINGFHGPTIDFNSIILRFYWDAQYVRKANYWLDIQIIWKSFLQAIRNLFVAIAK